MSTRARQHLVCTDPRRATCQRCGRTVLDGIDFGTPYRVDAIPLTLLGEATARLAGRGTYRLMAGRFVRREHHDITGDSTRGRPPVCGIHSCAPVDPTHVDPAHVPTFLNLTADTQSEQDHGQTVLLVLGGAVTGAPVLALPIDTDTPPF